MVPDPVDAMDEHTLQGALLSTEWLSASALSVFVIIPHKDLKGTCTTVSESEKNDGISVFREKGSILEVNDGNLYFTAIIF